MTYGEFKAYLFITGFIPHTTLHTVWNKKYISVKISKFNNEIIINAPWIVKPLNTGDVNLAKRFLDDLQDNSKVIDNASYHT